MKTRTLYFNGRFITHMCLELFYMFMLGEKEVNLNEVKKMVLSLSSSTNKI